MLVDKNRNIIPLGSIVFGSLPTETENHYWNFGIGVDGNFELLACTYGYVHNITQKEMSNMEYMGEIV